MQKECTICKKILPYSEFYRRVKNGRLLSFCKKCDRLRSLKPSYVIRAKFRRSINRSKKKGQVFDLQFDYFSSLVKKICFYCDGYFQTGDIVGLDRVDNNRGYEKDNVVPSCMTCNRLKNDCFTLEETKEMVSVVVRMRKERK